MDNLFRDIIDITGVKGVFLFSQTGAPIYKGFAAESSIKEIENEKFWATAFKSFKDVKECEIVFETYRLYIKSTNLGMLLIWMEHDIPAALVRLNCDIATDSLKKEKTSSKRRWGIFKKR